MQTILSFAVPTLTSLVGSSFLRRSDPAIDVLKQMRGLNQPSEFVALVRATDAFFATVESQEPGYQFLANRYMHEIEARMKDLCDAARRSKEDEVLDLLVYLEEEECHRLISRCQSVMQNLLLE